MPNRSGGGGSDGGGDGDEESKVVRFEMREGTSKVLLALGEMEMDGDDRIRFWRLKKTRCW